MASRTVASSALLTVSAWSAGGVTARTLPLTADGSSVGEILRSVAESHPDTQSQLFAADGGLNRYVNVYLNDEDVRVLDGLATAVGEADTLVILPAMAGG